MFTNNRKERLHNTQAFGSCKQHKPYENKFCKTHCGVKVKIFRSIQQLILFKSVLLFSGKMLKTLFNETKMLLLKHCFTCISNTAYVLLCKFCENMFAWQMLHKRKLYFCLPLTTSWKLGDMPITMRQLCC